MAQYKRFPIQCRPGIAGAGYSTAPGENEGVTPFWSAGDKMRFTGGWPQAWGGNDDVTLSTTNVNAASVLIGTPSTFKYFNINGSEWYFIGTTQAFYAINSSAQAFNIAPLRTSNTAIANSLATQFDSLGSNPLATTSGNGLIIVTHASHGLRSGDTVTLSGAADTNGITAAQINTSFTVTVLTTSTYRISTAGTASSTGSGGGASVKAATGRVRVSHTAHGFSAGFRVKLSGAADFGGITAATYVNREHVIRTVVDANTYDIYVGTNATSSVSSAGGASTVEYAQIDMSDGTYPTIWSIDLFDDDIVCCPGNARGIYAWTGSVDVAPTLITNAPTQANGIFVLNGKLCAYGTYSALEGNQKGNRLANCNTGDYTDWTIADGSQAYEDVKEQAGRFIAHSIIGDRVYLFTETAAFTNDDVGGSDIWIFRPLSASFGACGQNSAIEIDGIVYCASPVGVFRINGDIAENILHPEDTNQYGLFAVQGVSPQRRMFAYYSTKFAELVIVSPGSNPANFGEYISYSIREGWWTYGGTLNRYAVAWQNPNEMLSINGSNTIYLDGDSIATPYATFDGNSAFSFIKSNWRSLDGGNNRALIHGIEIAGKYSGQISVTLEYKDNFLGDDFGDWDTLGPFTLEQSSNDNTYLYLGPVSAQYWRWKFQNGTGSYGMRLSGFKELISPGPPY